MKLKDMPMTLIVLTPMFIGGLIGISTKSVPKEVSHGEHMGVRWKVMKGKSGYFAMIFSESKNGWVRAGGTLQNQDSVEATILAWIEAA